MAEMTFYGRLVALVALALGLGPVAEGAATTNVLLICVDDLRPELASFGATYIRSPNMDRLAAKGRPFFAHYVNAPSCGPSRYTLLTGRYGPAGNQALFQRAEALKDDPAGTAPSMPEWFRKQGYTTVSVGKVSHHPGGRGGPNWDLGADIEMPGAWDRHLMPSGKWLHPRGAMHGLAHGEIRVNAGQMDVYQAVPGPDTIYPDGLIANEALQQLDALAGDPDTPFFLAVGFIRPHLPFGAPQKYLELYAGVDLPPIPHAEKPAGRTTWHGSGEFMNYHRWGRDPRSDPEFATDLRRHYAACVSYADAQVGRILDRLARTGAASNTVIVLWGDHGWHLGEHGIWGKHSLFEEALHSPLVIWHPGIDRPGVPSRAVVETLDVFPTLCELAGIPVPTFTQGVSLRPMLDRPEAPGHAAIGYLGKARTIRTATHRLIVHKDGATELYDHSTPERETKNIADSDPRRVAELGELLAARMKQELPGR